MAHRKKRGKKSIILPKAQINCEHNKAVSDTVNTYIIQDIRRTKGLNLSDFSKTHQKAIIQSEKNLKGHKVTEKEFNRNVEELNKLVKQKKNVEK